MGRRYAELAFTPLVKEQQERHGSRRQYARVEQSGQPGDRLGPHERSFIQSMDGFYMASVSETGWPYVQFRGGEKGFLRVLDDRTIAFADLRGNTQYISLGNLLHDDRVALFLMDYARQTRLKIMGRAAIHETDASRCRSRRAAPSARREINRRAGVHHPRGSLRLELPTAHHAALHAGGTGGSPGAHAETAGRAGRRECASEGRG